MVFLAGEAACAGDPSAPVAGAIRVATYNIAMYADRAGRVAERLATGEDRQAQAIAEVIQRVRPDVLLLCEIDHDPVADPPGLLAKRYLAKRQATDLEPIDYAHRFSAPVNTGKPSGLDLDRDGAVDGPADAWGYGRYPGQYGMAVLSRFSIDAEATRTFQHLRWADLPGARRPTDPQSGEPFYPAEIWSELRLPSKSLWDVVVRPPGVAPLHLIASHPTPPVFDGPEDRNGCRNADEVRLVQAYVEGKLGAYFIDDQGRKESLGAGVDFVVLGDLNADPTDGNGQREALRRLLASERLAPDPEPSSVGAAAASREHADLNAGRTGDPSRDTGDFGRDGHGNLRIDYALPSAGMTVVGSGVYWPAPGEPGAKAAAASDHRLVWVDVTRRSRR